MGKAKRDEEKESRGAAARLTRHHQDAPGAHRQSPGSQKGDILTSGSWRIAPCPNSVTSKAPHSSHWGFFFFKTQLSPAGGCLAVFHSYWATAPPCGLLRSHIWCTLSTRLLNSDWDGPGDQRLGRPVSILGVNACEKHTEVMTSTKITVQEVCKTLFCVGLIILIPYSHLYI